MGGSGVQSHYMILSCFREARLFYTSSENNYHNNKKLFWSRFSIEPHVRWPFWSQAFRENVLLPPFSGDSRDCDARPFGALAASVSRSFSFSQLQGALHWKDTCSEKLFWVRVCHTVLKTLTLFQTKIYDFPDLFQTTWSGLNRVM